MLNRIYRFFFQQAVNIRGMHNYIQDASHSKRIFYSKPASIVKRACMELLLIRLRNMTINTGLVGREYKSTPSLNCGFLSQYKLTG